MKQFVVVRRSALPTPRTNVYGPFQSPGDAAMWAKDEFGTACDWSVLAITEVAA